MKLLSKIPLVTVSIGLVIGLAFVTTAPASAVTTDTSATCTRITTLSNSSAAAVSARLATINKDFETRLTNIASRDTTIDTQVKDARTKASQAFDKKITVMSSAEGLTTAQQGAIKAYSISMYSAETVREKAVDTAKLTYRTALTETVKTHQIALTKAVTAYQTSVAAAFTTAQATCNDSNALSTLKISVKASKEALKSARSDAKVTTTIQSLMTARNDAIKAANTEFAKAAAVYTTTLSAVLDGTDTATQQ